MAQWNESAAAQTRSDAQMNTTQRTAWTCLGGRYHAVPAAELQPLRAHFGLTDEFDADVRSPTTDRIVPPVRPSAVITPCLGAQACRTAPASRRCRRVAAARAVCLQVGRRLYARSQAWRSLVRLTASVSSPGTDVGGAGPVLVHMSKECTQSSCA